MTKNCSKWSNMVKLGLKWYTMIKNGPKWSNMVLYDLIWSNMVQIISLRSSKWVRHNQVSWSSFLLFWYWFYYPHMLKDSLKFSKVPDKRADATPPYICTLPLQSTTALYHCDVLVHSTTFTVTVTFPFTLIFLFTSTAWLSKCFENILGDYILPIIDKYLDPGQCGGLKKSSINHYLIKLLDLAHITLDLSTPHCAILCTEDLSKAYNRGSHNLVVEDLHAMHIPKWSIGIICSYLRERSCILSYQNQI